MNSDQFGRWFQSRSYPWVTGQPLDIDMSYLSQARHMAAPEVCITQLVFEGTITPVGGTFQGEDTSKLFANASLRDEAELVNASGNGLRHLAMMELGSKYVDPADIGVGVATAVKYRLPIMHEPLDTRAVRPRDFRIPLANFLEGGNLLINLAGTLPTNIGVAAADWSVQVYNYVVDGRVKELKSRRRIWEQVIGQQEYDYQVNGCIRSAIVTSNLLTTLYTDLSAYSTLYSRTLDLPPAFKTHILQDHYRRSSDSLSSTDEFVAATNYAIPLVIPNRSKKTGGMINTPTLHLDMRAAAPASGRLLMDAVVDRTPNIAALGMGYGSAEELAHAVLERGEVVGAAGNMRARDLPKSLARKLPIRIK